ncbi:unnamed protein product [Brassica oleracea var. botrytis]
MTKAGCYDNWGADSLPLCYNNQATESLTGIFYVLSEFANMSSLLINPAKSSIFMTCRINQAFKDEVQRLGIPIELPGTTFYHEDNDSC